MNKWFKTNKFLRTALFYLVIFFIISKIINVEFTELLPIAFAIIFIVFTGSIKDKKKSSSLPKKPFVNEIIKAKSNAKWEYDRKRFDIK